MPWTLTTNELIRQIQKINMFILETTSPFSTTIATNPVVKEDPDLTVAAITGIGDGEYAIVNGTGGPEIVEVSGAPAGNTVTLRQPVLRAQAIGATVKQARKIDLGYIESAGIQPGFNRQVTPVEAANAETALVFVEGPLQISLAFNMLTFNLPQILASQGLTQDESGAGTAADPYAIIIGPESTKEAVLAFRGEALLHDGQVLELDFLDARMQSSGNLSIGRTNPTTIPFSLQCSAMLGRMWTP